jgi:hypothetical protein
VLIGIIAAHTQDLKSSSTGFSAIRDQVDAMKIFLNPASDYMNISLNSNVAELTEITIYEQRGRKMCTSKCNYDGVI